jgi:hypothetical protein
MSPDLKDFTDGKGDAKSTDIDDKYYKTDAFPTSASNNDFKRAYSSQAPGLLGNLSRRRTDARSGAGGLGQHNQVTIISI